MSNHTMVIVRIDDRKLFELFCKSCKECEYVKVDSSLRLVGFSENMKFDVETGIVDGALGGIIVKSDTCYLIDSIQCKIDTFDVKIQRNSIDPKKPDTINNWYDHINVSFKPISPPPYNQNTSIKPEQLAIFAKIALIFGQNFAQLDAVKAMVSSTADGGKEHFASRVDALTRLEVLQDKFLHEMAEFTRVRMNEFIEKGNALEAAVLERRSKLEAEYSELKEQLIQEKEAIETHRMEVEAELAARMKQLDDRSAMHARREQHKEQRTALRSAITDFRTTPNTSRLRTEVIVVTSVLMTCLGLGALLYGLIPINDMRGSLSASSVFVMVRQLLFTAGFVGVAAFLIRFLNRWFQRRADEETRLERFLRDVDRANWILEAMMEWKEEKGADPPALIIEKLSNNLFVDTLDRDSDMNPLETLASAVLGNAANLDIELPGLKARLDRKSLKNIDSQSNKD